jgi:hypothetical protein
MAGLPLAESVSDLFDAALLDAYPELRELRVSATRATLDAVVASGPMSLSLGGVFERDELLSDVGTMWLARTTGSVRLPAMLSTTVALERAVGSRVAEHAAGRVSVAVGQRVGASFADLEWGIGFRTGSLWETERSGSTVAAAVRAGLADAVSLYGAVGAQRDPYGPDGWLRFASFGVGLRFGSLSVDLRRGGQTASRAAPTAVSVQLGSER